MQQCSDGVTRMAENSLGLCVTDPTIQSVDECLLPTTTDAMSDSSATNLQKSLDMFMDVHLHVVEPAVEPAASDECASITVIAHCLAQYISTLDIKHQNHVQSLLQSDTVSWISKLFR